MKEEIREAYARAATESLSLCATDAYQGMDLSWIPERVLSTNQGCGSPVRDAQNDIRPGNVVLDLAAELVGDGAADPVIDLDIYRRLTEGELQ